MKCGVDLSRRWEFRWEEKASCVEFKWFVVNKDLTCFSWNSLVGFHSLEGWIGKAKGNFPKLRTVKEKLGKESKAFEGSGEMTQHSIKVSEERTELREWVTGEQAMAWLQELMVKTKTIFLVEVKAKGKKIRKENWERTAASFRP